MRFKLKNPRFWLVGTLLTALFFRVWNLWRFGLHHDAALNSARALGWFDFLVGMGQTTPILWFGHIPTWANLSFHDHPPLSFFLQKVGFLIFGDSSFVALLPFVAAGVVATWIIFKLVKEHVSEPSGLWAAAIFGLSSYAVWSARSGYLEGILILWISLSLYFFVSFASARRHRDLYLWMITVALALLTKYTAVFLLPAGVFYLLLNNRRVFLSKHFWLALLVFLALLSPVIIYNFQVFAARGHFDAGFSSMLGLNPADYSTLAYRSLAFQPGMNLWNIYLSVKNNSSLPLVLLFLFSVFYSLWLILQRRAAPLSQIALMNILMQCAMFAFSGAADRFVPIILPFLSVLAGVTIVAGVEHFSAKIFFRRLLAGAGAFVIAGELLYGLNTNVLITPIGSPGLVYGVSRFEVDGFEDLDRYLRKKVLGPRGAPRRIARLNERSAELSVKAKEAVLFDERADWFSRVWYVDRYKHYYSRPVIYFTDLNNSIAQSSDPTIDFLAYLRQGGATGVWVVLAAGPAVSVDADADYSVFMEQLRDQLIRAGVLEQEIKNGFGQVVFQIFYFR